MRQSTEGSWGSVGFPFSLPQAAGLFVLEGEFGHQKNSFTSLPSWSQLCYTPPRVGTPPPISCFTQSYKKSADTFLLRVHSDCVAGGQQNCHTMKGTSQIILS